MGYAVGFFTLLAFIIIREAFYQYTMNKLLNKAMSRSYFEYKQADQLKPEDKKENKIVEDDPEDLGVLDGIGVI